MRWRPRSEKPDLELGELDLFSGLRVAALKRIGSLCTEVSVPPGRVLTVEGTPPRQAFVIRSGRVAVRTSDHEFSTLGDGCLVGEMAFVYGVPRVATTTVLADTRLLVFNPTEFRQLLEEPEVRARVLDVADARREATLARPPAWLDAALDAVPGFKRLVTARAEPTWRPVGLVGR